MPLAFFLSLSGRVRPRSNALLLFTTLYGNWPLICFTPPCKFKWLFNTPRMTFNLINHGSRKLCKYIHKNGSHSTTVFICLFWSESVLQMVFLPEGCDFIASNRNQAIEFSQDISGPFVSKLQNLAREKSTWLSAGGIHLVSSIYLIPSWASFKTIFTF